MGSIAVPPAGSRLGSAATASDVVCRVCHETFVPDEGWPHAIVCSHLCRLQLWGMPSGAAMEVLCAYCGDAADTEDHVPPQKARASIIAMGEQERYPFFTVPACKECNSAILGSKPYWTLAERFAFVAKRLKERHHDILHMPDWDEEEIEELGPGMRRMVTSGLRKRARMQSRVAWADLRAAEGAIWDELAKKTGGRQAEVAKLLRL